MSEPTTDTSNYSDAKAQAKAAKAYAKAQRPWFKKKRFIIPIVLVVIVVLAQLTSGGEGGAERVSASDDSDSSVSDDSDSSVSKDNPLQVGETVSLEGTEYTVDGVRTEDAVGDEFFREEASGKYVVVDITIENKKDETRVFSDEATKFISSDDKSYSTDFDATWALIGDDADAVLLWEDMQPDLPMEGTLVFDVPEDRVSGGLLEVSDLFGAGEAYIDLGLE